MKDRLARLPVAIESALKHRQIEKEKKESAEKLIQSEKNYRTIFYKSPLPKWVYDSETLRFLEVNEAATRHYGYTQEEFLSMTINDIRPKEDIELLAGDFPGCTHIELLAMHGSARAHPVPDAAPREVLRLLMKEHGLTQTALRDELGGQSVVSDILKGKREINSRQAKALASRFGVSPAAFI